MKLRALIVAPDYPPTNRIASLRAYYFALALAESGYQVEVIAEPAPPDSRDLFRLDGDVTVNRISAPHRAIWLLKAAWHVAFTMRERRPDVVVSTCGPFLAHVVALVAKTLFWRSYWVADYRDLWASGLYYGGDSAEDTLDRGIVRKFCERWVVRHSDLITTVSRGLQKNLLQFHGREVLVYHNGFEQQQKVTDSAHPDQDDVITICHTGSLYSNRSPEAFLLAFDAATANTSDYPKRLSLQFAGPLDSAVRETIASYRNRTDISYLGTLPRAEAYRLQASSDYCLLIEDSVASMRGVLTGKVFEYIGMRKPIIAFGVAPDSELAEILRGSGLAAFCGGDVGELVAFLENLLQGNAKIETSPNEARINSFGREHISRALVDEINRRLLGRP